MRNRKRIFKRGLSLLVVLLMCLSALPGTALAAEGNNGQDNWGQLKKQCTLCESSNVEADDPNKTAACNDCGAVLRRNADGDLVWEESAQPNPEPVDPVDPDPAKLTISLTALPAEEMRGTETGGVYDSSNGNKQYRPGEGEMETVLPGGRFFYHVEITGEPETTAAVSLDFSSGMQIIGSAAHSTREGDGATQEYFVLNENGTASWDILVKAHGTAMSGEKLTCTASVFGPEDVTASCTVTIGGGEQPPVPECLHDVCKWESQIGENEQVIGVCKCMACGQEIEICEHAGNSTFAMDSEDGDQHGLYCNYCGQKIGTAPHNYGDGDTCTCGAKKPAEPVTPPEDCVSHTFTASGHDEKEHWNKCVQCGKIEGTSREEHMFGEPEVTEDPTCTAPGQETIQCTVCGYAKTEEIPAEHKWRDDATNVEPTCTEEGKHTRRCTECGVIETETIEPLGHKWETVQIGTGSKKVCKVCGKEVIDADPACRHEKYDEEITKPAACTEGGERTITCRGCGYSKIEEIPAAGHQYGEWIGVGTGHYKECAACGLKTAQEEHVFDKTIKNPTCTDEGVEAGLCGDCGYHYERPLEMLEHVYENDVCVNCGAAKADHAHVWYEDGALSWPATCTASGYNVYKCSVGNCAESVSRTAVSLGHAYGPWTVTKAATGTEAGEQERVCTRCGGVETGVIPATGENPNRPSGGGSGSGGGSSNRPSRPSSGGGGRDNTPTTTIQENPTPLAPTVNIEDEDTPLAGLPGFLDVKPGDWFYDAVVYVYGHGLMNGLSGTAFGPSDSTLRGMIVTVLHRMEDTPDADPADFLDVLVDRYYYDAVGWGAGNEIVNGYGNGLFGPEDTITREQLAAILYRYAQFKGYDVLDRADLSAFSDVDRISAYALEPMQWAVAEGLINGVSDTMLSPKSHATRAQIAMILMRFEENIAA